MSVSEYEIHCRCYARKIGYPSAKCSLDTDSSSASWFQLAVAARVAGPEAACLVASCSQAKAFLRVMELRPLVTEADQRRQLFWQQAVAHLEDQALR